MRSYTTLVAVILMMTVTGPGAWAGDQVIRIGVPTPLTGTYASDAFGYRQCLAFAVQEINDGGGLLGKTLEMVPYDIGVFSPEKMLAAAVVLIDRENVDTVHAGWSGWGQNVRAFGKYSVPTFFADASISSIREYRKDSLQYSNIFQMCDVEGPLAEGVLEMMNALPYQYRNRKMVTIVSDDEWGCQVGRAIDLHAPEKGWEVAMHEVVPYGISDWNALLAKIRKINPGWIHFEMVSPADVIAFMHQFKKAPTRSLINLGYGLMPPALIKTMGAEADGLLGKVVFTMPLPDGLAPQADAWLKTFRARYGNNPMAAGYLSYVSLKMWAEAVLQAKDEKAYGRINQILSQMTYRCVAGGVWTFDRDHKIPMSKNTPMLGMQVQNGQVVTICKVADETQTVRRFQVPPWIRSSVDETALPSDTDQ